jgi:hypothetical protein
MRVGWLVGRDWLVGRGLPLSIFRALSTPIHRLVLKNPQWTEPFHAAVVIDWFFDLCFFWSLPVLFLDKYSFKYKYYFHFHIVFRKQMERKFHGLVIF